MGFNFSWTRKIFRIEYFQYINYFRARRFFQGSKIFQGQKTFRVSSPVWLNSFKVNLCLGFNTLRLRFFWVFKSLPAISGLDESRIYFKLQDLKYFLFQNENNSNLVQKFDIGVIPDVGSRQSRSLLSFGQNSAAQKCKCQTQFDWTKNLKVNYFANAFKTNEDLEAAKNRRA